MCCSPKLLGWKHDWRLKALRGVLWTSSDPQRDRLNRGHRRLGNTCWDVFIHRHAKDGAGREKPWQAGAADRVGSWAREIISTWMLVYATYLESTHTRLHSQTVRHASEFALIDQMQTRRAAALGGQGKKGTSRVPRSWGLKPKLLKSCQVRSTRPSYTRTQARVGRALA